MKLIVLGSSSSGNCYILDSENEALIIEAGIRLSEVKKALRFNISKVFGVIVTHEHNDHAGYVKDFAAAGITVFALDEVFSSKGFSENESFTKRIIPGRGYKVGNFKIIPFSVNHDVPCVGYQVEHPEIGKLLFVTDTMMLEYTFPGLNHILIEANYSDGILADNIDNGRIPAIMRDRIMRSHMEIETTKEILQSNDLSGVRNIVLIHLSNGNSNEKVFTEEITKATGKPVYAASKGMELDLSLNPY